MKQRVDNDCNSARELADSIYSRIQDLPRDNMTVKFSNDFSKELKRFEAISQKVASLNGKNNSNTNTNSMGERPPVYGSSGRGDEYSIDMSNHDPYEQSVGTGESSSHQLLDQETMQRMNLEEKKRRHAEIIQVEHDVTELSEMFKEMQSIVHEQGEKLDTIENNISVAHEQLDQAHDELVEAEDYQRKARRKKCLLILILVIVCAVIILIVGKTMFN